MIRIAIIEDNKEERKQIEDYLCDLSTKDHLEFEIVQFPSGLAFLADQVSTYDIIFMDIDMPGMDGLETARALRQTDPAVILIFVTNMAQHAISGYKVDAMDYILKPVNKYSFQLKIRRAVARTAKQKENYISIQEEGELYKVPLLAIHYIDADGHYICYHTANHVYKEYTTLKDAFRKIDRPYFVFCSRSYLVNLKYVDAVQQDTVTVAGANLQISRPQRKAFLDALSDFIGGKL